MKIIAASERRKLAAGENDRIRQNSRTSGRGEVAVQFAQNNPHRSSFRSWLLRRRICLLPAAKQQIPRATKLRLGMTILWGFSNYIITPHRAHYDPG
jgi:hypothetical protein